MGGGNCLTESADKTISLFRGNVPVVEVASANANLTKLPDEEPLRAGAMETATRCFDLLCLGKCTKSGELKLNIQSASKIPELITKNEKGDPVFKEPEPMCTIQAPTGHSVWINVELRTVTTKASDYMCLGIRKRGEKDYYDVLYNVDGHKSRYVDVLETDVVELVPLASSTPLSTKYTPVKVGDSAKITSANSYDFGSVYRVNVTLHNSQWIDQTCNLNTLAESTWNNCGRIGVGLVNKDNIPTLQLLAVNVSNGQLASSHDGIHWTPQISIGGNGNSWHAGPAYGNGIWCVIGPKLSVHSYDHAISWQSSATSISDPRILAFGNGVFMTVDVNMYVYTSPDAETWTKLGKIPGTPGYYISILCYCKNKWVAADISCNEHWSKDGNEWISSESNPSLYSIRNGYWYGSYCIDNSYMHVNSCDNAYKSNTIIAKSPDGKKWIPVKEIPCSSTHRANCLFKNKLYIFAEDGSHFHVGLFRPDGTIDEI